MIVISQSGTHIYNFDNCKEIYATPSENDLSIRIIVNGDAKGYEIGRYETSTDRTIAMSIISDFILQKRTIKIPTMKEVQAYLARTHAEIQRAENGKKTVRRGGS